MSAFALDLEKFVEKAGRNADLVVRKIGIDVLSSVVQKSPVDTGRFRANWVTSIGAPAKTTTEKLDPSGSAAIQEGTGKLINYKVGPSIFMTNSLPYAQRLENGWSKQAPVGMVKITVSEFQDFVNKAVRELP